MVACRLCRACRFGENVHCEDSKSLGINLDNGDDKKYKTIAYCCQAQSLARACRRCGTGIVINRTLFEPGSKEESGPIQFQGYCVKQYATVASMRSPDVRLIVQTWHLFATACHNDHRSGKVGLPLPQSSLNTKVCFRMRHPTISEPQEFLDHRHAITSSYQLQLSCLLPCPLTSLSSRSPILLLPGFPYPSLPAKQFNLRTAIRTRTSCIQSRCSELSLAFMRERGGIPLGRFHTGSRVASCAYSGTSSLKEVLGVDGFRRDRTAPWQPRRPT